MPINAAPDLTSENRQMHPPEIEPIAWIFLGTARALHDASERQMRIRKNLSHIRSPLLGYCLKGRVRTGHSDKAQKLGTDGTFTNFHSFKNR